MCKTPKWIFTYSNGVVCCAKNRNPIALIVDLNFMLLNKIHKTHFRIDRTFHLVFLSPRMCVLVLVCVCLCVCLCVCVYIIKICVHMERRGQFAMCFSCPEVIEASCV